MSFADWSQKYLKFFLFSIHTIEATSTQEENICQETVNEADVGEIHQAFDVYPSDCSSENNSQEMTNTGKIRYIIKWNKFSQL